jgi:hypothetical protein
VVAGVQDAVHDRVAQQQVARGHVDPGPQRAAAVGELAGAHAREQVEVLVDAAVAPGAVASRLGRTAAVLADGLAVQVADIRLALANQLDGTVVEFAALLQLSHEATYRALRALVDAGQVINPSRGEYRLRAET